jgi:hypothetical protein
MARGNSGKIVLEIEPAEKEKLYSAVKSDGLTMKEWFLQQMTNYLERSVIAEQRAVYGARSFKSRSLKGRAAKKRKQRG